jgi:hypothetical protein
VIFLSLISVLEKASESGSGWVRDGYVGCAMGIASGQAHCGLMPELYPDVGLKMPFAYFLRNISHGQSTDLWSA